MDETTLHFELKLSDALRRAGETEVPRVGASWLLIPLEYEIMRALCCPQCRRASLARRAQSSLMHRDDEHFREWPFPSPAGDRLGCVCEACGHVAQLYFWFINGDLESLKGTP